MTGPLLGRVLLTPSISGPTCPPVALTLPPILEAGLPPLTTSLGSTHYPFDRRVWDGTNGSVSLESFTPTGGFPHNVLLVSARWLGPVLGAAPERTAPAIYDLEDTPAATWALRR